MVTVSEFLKNNGLLHNATTGVNDYDFFHKVVQFDDDPNTVASGEATILFSGPPVLNPATPYPGNGIADLLVPVGSVQGFQDSEQPNVTPFREMGSRLKRFAVGAAEYQVSISKVQTYHSNLRNALYAWLTKMTNAPDQFIMAPSVNNAPGNAHLITMESDLFRLPFGMFLATITAGGNYVVGEYFERCLLLNAGKSVQAGQALIQEQVSIAVTRKVPAAGITLNLDLAQQAFSLSAGNDSVVTNG